ncbi:MAG TPA: class E sortase [Lapillicoccus sp.]|uniref:class E sortase n=1 Tax=Lapillicoccus sp. TaxID=1909287 RepID=UPI002F9332AE
MRVVRGVVGTVGELAITAGVLLLLFVVWELGVVGFTTNRAQAATVDTLERQFAQPTPTAPSTSSPTASPTTPTTVPVPPPGDAYAILRIPRLGAAWAKPVYQGVGLDVLAKGIGHYPDTQLPGQVGNAAFAGHRAGHGNPLIDIDTIRPGDAIVVETADTYVIYRADRSEIVPPTDVKVLAPVPDQPGVAPTEAWLTLTSCEPKYGSTNRFIVFAKLDRSVPRAQGLPADVLAPPGGNG